MLYCLVGIGGAIGFLGQEVNFLGSEPPSESIIQEEIVQLVWTNKVFRLLRYIALLVSGDELGTDWSVNNIMQDGSGAIVLDTIGYPLNQMVGTDVFTPYMLMWSPL